MDHLIGASRSSRGGKHFVIRRSCAREDSWVSIPLEEVCHRNTVPLAMCQGCFSATAYTEGHAAHRTDEERV